MIWPEIKLASIGQGEVWDIHLFFTLRWEKCQMEPSKIINSEVL